VDLGKVLDAVAVDLRDVPEAVLEQQ